MWLQGDTCVRVCVNPTLWGQNVNFFGPYEGKTAYKSYQVMFLENVKMHF